MIHKTKYSLLISFCVLVLSSCMASPNLANNIVNDNKNVVNVSIDAALLEAIRGKVSDKGLSTGQQTPSSASPDLEIESHPDEKEKISQAIHDNAAFINKEDYKAYTSSFHPDSVFIPELKQIFDFLLKTHTNYFILEVDLERLSANRASVYVNREVTNIYGTVEQDILYTMRKDKDEWKIYFMTDQTF